MKRIVSIVSALVIAVCAMAQEKIVLRLYPDGDERNDAQNVERYDKWGSTFESSYPDLTVYLPPANDRTGQMILCCPGGGYVMLATRHEGTFVAEELNKTGVAVAVLKYRMPEGRDTAPLEDVHTAMRLLREHCPGWGINQVGIMGFSAGGHLASTALVRYADRVERPDFGILFYPVISFEDYPHQGTRKALLRGHETDELVHYYSNQHFVTEDTPPTLILLSSNDDVVDPRHSLLFYEQLVKHNVYCQMLAIPEGGHGWGYIPDAVAIYRNEINTAVRHWLSRCVAVLK